MITKMKYQLTHQSCVEAYTEILERLGSNVVDMPDTIKKGLEILRLCGDNTLIYKLVLDVSNVSVENMKQVIGRDGYYFHITTNLCGLDFIWHNHTTQQIEFWGPSAKNVHNGKKEIMKRIMKQRY